MTRVYLGLVSEDAGNLVGIAIVSILIPLGLLLYLWRLSRRDASQEVEVLKPELAVWSALLTLVLTVGFIYVVLIAAFITWLVIAPLS
jgi:hypothetical protein